MVFYQVASTFILFEMVEMTTSLYRLCSESAQVIYNRRQVVRVIRLDHLTFPAETEDSHLFTHQPLKRG
jgi:hypothetical protein